MMHLLTLISALGIAIVAFLGLLTSYGLSAQAVQLRAVENGTEWRMLEPDPARWITSTQPVTVSVQVTNDAGVVIGTASFNTGTIFIIPDETVVSTKSLILQAAVQFTEQGSNTLTVTVTVTDPVTPPAQSVNKAFTLLIDSVSPTATFTMPVAGSVWMTGTNVQIAWIVTETTSGITPTQVWFKPTAGADAILVSTTQYTLLDWMLPNTVTITSTDARLELRLMDIAGNSAIAYSPFISIAKPPPATQYYTSYLPLISMGCDNEAGDWCEPNNSIATAFPLALNYQITATVNITTDRSDYYQLVFPSQKPYTATLKLVLPCTEPTCDLDLYLYNQGGSIVAQSNIAGIGNETLYYTPTITASPYYLRVYAFSSPITPTRYTLIVK